MSIQRVGSGTHVTTNYGVSIWWSNSYNVRIEVLGRHFNNVVGLCGTFNNDRSDDLLTRENITTTDVNAFGDSWKTNTYCDDSSDVDNPCLKNPYRAAMARESCSALLRAPFWSCNRTVDATEEHFVSSCEYDMCACDNNPIACLCQVFEAYTTECFARGITVDWMDDFPQCSKHFFF